jgi:hypothetical protein
MSPVKYELGFYIPEDDILHIRIGSANPSSVEAWRQGTKIYQEWRLPR